MMELLSSSQKEGVMPKPLDYLKQSLYLVLICFLINFVLLEFRNICSATEKLLNKVESVRSFEVASVKISFDSENVTAAFSDLKMDGTLALPHSWLISGSTSLAKFRSDSCQPR
jgi:hypothetical protein